MTLVRHLLYSVVFCTGVLISDSANASDFLWRGESLDVFHLAVAEGHLETVKFCLRHGAGVSKHRLESGDTALSVAAREGRTEMLSYLLQHTTHLEGHVDARPPLHEAVYRGNVACVKVLLQAGADVNEISLGKAYVAPPIYFPRFYKVTPLHLATWHGHRDVAALLIAAGAKSLLDTGRGHPGSNKRRDNLLMNAPTHDIFTASALGNISALKAILLNSGTKIRGQFKAPKGYPPPLQWAAVNGQSEVVSFLLEKGYDINEAFGGVRPGVGITALHWAALRGHLDCVKALMLRGANINIKISVHGYLPLHFAVIGGHTNVARFLLANASEKYRYWVDDRQRALFIAARNGNIELIDMMFGAGADLKMVLGNKGPALHEAARKGHLEAIRKLLDLGADTNLRNQRGQTVLNVAAEAGYKEVVILLLERGMNVNVATSYRDTPLLEAATAGHVKVVEVLLARGADPTIRGPTQRIALDEASLKGHKDVVAILTIPTRLAELRKKIQQFRKERGRFPKNLKEVAPYGVSRTAIKNLNGLTYNAVTGSVTISAPN